MEDVGRKWYSTFTKKTFLLLYYESRQVVSACGMGQVSFGWKAPVQNQYLASFQDHVFSFLLCFNMVKGLLLKVFVATRNIDLMEKDV